MMLISWLKCLTLKLKGQRSIIIPMQKVKLLIITIPFCLLQLILMITYKKLEIGEKAHPVDFGWAFSATERGNFNEHRKRVCS